MHIYKLMLYDLSSYKTDVTCIVISIYKDEPLRCPNYTVYMAEVCLEATC